MRYVSTRLEQTVEIEQLAGRATIEGEAPPARPQAAARRARVREVEAPAVRETPAVVTSAAAADTRQRPLFADLG